MAMIAISAAALLAAASLPGSYDCTIERQVLVTESGVQPGEAVSFSGADRDAWRFSVTVPRGDGPVTLTWAANPIQIAGRHASLPIAPGQLAFVALSAGPCMFTEGPCATLVELSARADGSAAFSILPAGSSVNAAGVRSLFHVIFTGTCRPQGRAG
jgi:hypothetical protein